MRGSLLAAMIVGLLGWGRNRKRGEKEDANGEGRGGGGGVAHLRKMA
jgi:hypothetical protein